MHSNRADCVFGDARLISSPTTMLAKTAPGLNENSWVSWLKIDTPVTSLGNKSGVNWMRRTEQSIEVASALASIVLPTPGTSSTSRWPSANKTDSASRTTAVLPSMTLSMFVTIASAAARNSAASMAGVGWVVEPMDGAVTGVLLTESG